MTSKLESDVCCRLQVAPSGESYGGKSESNGSLLPGLWRDSLHVTCGLTACTPGSAPGPTLGNEYGKTFTLLTNTDGQTTTHACLWNTTVGRCHTHLLSVCSCYGAAVSQWLADLQHILAAQQLSTDCTLKDMNARADVAVQFRQHLKTHLFRT